MLLGKSIKNTDLRSIKTCRLRVSWTGKARSDQVEKTEVF